MRKIFLYILLTVLSLPLAAKLTVVAVVDGLDEANLRMLRPYWSPGGLRTLSEEAYQTTISWPQAVYGDHAPIATLLTGTTPSAHGYSMDYYYSRRDRNLHLFLEDDAVRGIGTGLKISPSALLSPTLTDELRMRQPQARMYAIGIDAIPTILLAGHAANACCWLDTASLRWVSSSFYSGGLPSSADAQNVAGRVTELASRTWTPRMEITAYASPTAEERKRAFAYTNSQYLRHMPVANTLVIELALALQKDESLGGKQQADMLLLHLTTLSPRAKTDVIHSAEHEDMYLSLNQDLGFLMEQLDRRLGRENYELLLVGIPRLGSGKEVLLRAGLQVNSFNVQRAAALTGTYLMALYGHERWVDGGYGQSIYLNRTLIEQKRLPLTTIQRQVADFLMDFEGVSVAFPRSEAFLHPDLSSMLNKRFAGDVVFQLQPGWQLYDGEDKVLDRVIDSNPLSPVLYWSAALRPMPQERLEATTVKQILNL